MALYHGGEPNDRRSAAEAPRSLRSMDQPLAHDSHRSTLRVLVVEPDGDTRRLYVDALRPLGCDAIEAADGREALVEALVRRPSLIVIEARLPLVNGPALCEIPRRDTQTCTSFTGPITPAWMISTTRR